jgi:hypothetical protein
MPRTSPTGVGTHFSWQGAPSEALREEWAAGTPASQIALKLSARFDFPMNKNAIIGRAHRMKLPARAVAPSAQGAAAPDGTILVRRPRRSDAPVVLPRMVAEARAVVAPAPAPALAPPPVLTVVRPTRTGEGCRYPLWGDGRPDHRYCDAPRPTDAAGAPISQYCTHHHRRCYLTPAQHAVQRRVWQADFRQGIKRNGGR